MAQKSNPAQIENIRKLLVEKFNKFLYEAGETVTQPSVGVLATEVSGPKKSDMTPGSIDVDMVIHKLNTIRSGRSFRDENIHSQMKAYFEQLDENEELALYAFLKGIAQIVTGEISGEQATEPEDTNPSLSIVNSNDVVSKQKTVSIKPNVVRQKAAEDTSSPITVKNK